MRWKQVFVSLVGGAAVFVACAGQKAVEPGAQGDGGVLDAVLDGVEDTLRDSLGVDIDPTKDADASPTADDFAAGTRIKPRFRSSAFADGAKGKVFVGWWDSEKKTACAPQTAADGKLRCLPVTPAAVMEYARDQQIFSDSTCTVPAFPVRSYCLPDVPLFAVRSVLGDTTCTSPVRVYKLTKPAAFPTKLFQKYAGPCTEWTGGGAGDAWEGVEIPASDFVEVTETVSP